MQCVGTQTGAVAILDYGALIISTVYSSRVRVHSNVWFRKCPATVGKVGLCVCVCGSEGIMRDRSLALQAAGRIKGTDLIKG